jgi:hypothetical protein
MSPLWLFSVSQACSGHPKCSDSPGEDFMFSAQELVFCLGIAKRGLEQKVVITNPSIIYWAFKFIRYCQSQGREMEKKDRVFKLSYGKLSYWITKGMNAMGVPGHWTSHGLRRGGASELLRLRVPLSEIANHGRWLSERSLREYLRKGEIAVLRLRGNVGRAVWLRAQMLAALHQAVWKDLA